jgi:PAS domain S-box-containing protein
MSAAIETLPEKIDAGVARKDSVLRNTLLVSLVVSASYYVTAKIGFAFSLQPGSVSTLWLPNSILLTGFLFIPKRFWWILILSAFPAHFACELQSGVPASMVLSWFASNCVQAVLAAALITYFIKESLRFDKFSHLLVFLLFGAFLAPFLASFLDIALVRLNGWGSDSYRDIWRIRFLSNVLATISIVPLIIGWANGGLSAARKAPVLRYLEAGVLTTGLFIVGILVFKSQHLLAETTPTILYWPLPFLIWATIRFGPRGASTSLLVVMFLAIVGATKGEGPFVASSAAMNAVSIQWFLIVVSIPLMALAAVIEERRRAEESARSNEERLALALEVAHMGTWDWDIANNQVTVSDTTKRMFGLAENVPAPALDLFYSLIHPDDRASVKLAMTTALETGSPYGADFRLAESGRWLHGKGDILYDAKGNPSRMLGVNIDITERKTAEEALRQSEARLERSQAFSLVMVTHVDLDGKWLKVPQTMCDLLGYSETELLTRTFLDITHPDDIEVSWSHWQRLIREEAKSFDLEKRYIHKDGHSVWVGLNCTVVEDDQGKPVHFLTYIRDITDRKIADQALSETNSRNQAILRALPDMMFLHSLDGEYLDFYTRDPALLKIPPNSILGKRVHDVLPPDLADRIMTCFGRVNSTDEIQVLEYSLELGGARREFEARVVAAGENKALSIVRDVTEARRAEEAARKSEAKLLLSNQQIRKLAARLMTAQEAERRRISLLLHDDVSQNIAALGLSLSRLKRKLPAGNELGSELDLLSTQTNNLTTQIRRLSHQLHPEVLEHVGLVAALDSYILEFGHVEKLDLSFTSEIGSEPLPFDLSVCLYRVALEALRNISLHSGTKSATISLKEEEGFLVLAVADFGRGFDIEKAKHGSGIGLLSTEERVKLLGGVFEVRSDSQSGTLLTARIPRVRSL